MTPSVLLVLVVLVLLMLLTLKSTGRKVMMYAYYEKNEAYKNNLRYFLKHGILPCVDYYIIVNGKCTIDLKNLPRNVSVLYRDNVGYDFGAWAHALKRIRGRRYTYYIFLNSSVKGPTRPDWLQEFMNLFDKPDVKLVGTTINVHTPPHATRVLSHVQSMFFILHSDALEYLKSRGFFDNFDNYTFNEVIANGEVKMSTEILQNNWNINCIVKGYRGRDYRKVTHNFNSHADRYLGDPYFIGAYFGDTIKPDDVIFFKTNRF